MDTLMVLSLAAPLLAAGLLWFPATRAPGLRLAPWAPLPALAWAAAAPATAELELPWLLLGTRLGLDETGRVFLLFTALIWLAAGWFARTWLAGDPRRHVFAGFFLLAQAGNLGVCLALDAASFYFFFALMSLAAYSLIVHDGSAASRHAGRVYLVLALAGETLILSGLLLADGAPHFLPLAAACLILGFGAKTGLPLLHVSLPLAYAAAPIPAAAALAGAMIKAGLLGWLRFLPLGEAALPETGIAFMLAGLLAIFLGVAAGLAQRQPGALLAYSSISQMGYVSLAVGTGLLAPGLWPLLLPAVALYALHHALAKAALFLGMGVARRHGATRTVMLGLALPALALAGAPFSSGMLAKAALKEGWVASPAPWPDLLAGLIPLAALGTALLMARLLWLVWRDAAAQAPSDAAAQPGLVAPWLLLLSASAGLTWAMMLPALPASTLRLAALLDAAWPPLAAALLGFVALRLRWRAPALPPGDMLVLLLRMLAFLHRRLASTSLPQWRIALPVGSRVPASFRSSQMESQLRAWGAAGALWLALLAAAIALLASG
jgi:formate hydrogenlyase subunit 3/multisubunit Na+/H+ antiporter MnhD subunit